MSPARFRAAALPILVAGLLLGASCGPKSLAARAVPFPAEKPVFTDAEGKPLKSLPPCVEPVRLVLIDAPWCPPCDDARKAIREASASFPKGMVRVYRVLVDRERFLAKEGPREVPPLEPTREFRLGEIPVTTLTALPGPFREQFRLEQFPVLLLMDPGGAIAGRWTGFSPGMAGALAGAVSRLSTSLRRPGT